MCGVLLGIADDGCSFADFVVYRGVSTSGAHLGAFRVDEDTEMWRDGTYVADDFLQTFRCRVRRVHADDIGSCVVKVADKLNLATEVAH